MERTEAKKRIEKLKEAINKYRYDYHVLDKSSIPESALDSLKKELFDLEDQFPELTTPDSPTQRVGGQPLNKFKKVDHKSRMLSLNDAFSREDLEDWLSRLTNHLGTTPKSDFYCDPKMDGLAVELVYKNGILIQGSTRGDGRIGEDITQNLRTLDAIPLQLNQKNEEVVVRGEAFLSTKEFNRINKEQLQKNEPTYANPRNIAAGSLRQLDPKVTASRRLDFFAYTLVTDLGQQTLNESYKLLNKLGFKTNPNGQVVKNLEEAISFQKNLAKKRSNLPYEIDGTVITLNDLALFKQAGVVGKAPRGAIAFKFPAEEKTTRVLAIRIQVGRTGALTPVADLEPVNIAGATIKHATLHNSDEIKRLKLKIGDTVVVSRAGDVIPKIIKVLAELRTGAEKSFHMPQNCPIDGSKVIRDGAIYRCSNPRCGARARQNLYHFVSRNAFNLDHLGPKIIDRLLDEGLITDAADLFSLEKDELRTLERFGEKSAQNIVDEVSEKKSISLPKFLYALGIRNVGEETAILLADQVKNAKTPAQVADRAKKLTLAELQSISDIGPVVAQNIVDWFKDPHNQNFLQRLDRVGIKFEASNSVNKALAGKTFVLTGTLESMSREQAKQAIRDLGGQISSSISKKTNYCLVGASPGSKYKKAQELNVEILREAQFLKMLQ